MIGTEFQAQATSQAERSPSPSDGWTLFPKLFLGASTIAIAAIVALSVTVDPYWAFRANPRWLEVTKGGNRLLDTEDRRAKPLQFMVRPAPGTVVIGSSVVYRGIDPDDMAPSLRSGFNFGMSTLMSYELPVLAKLITTRPRPDTVVIGLDYFAFTDFRMRVQVDPALTTRAGRLDLLVSSLLSWRSLQGTKKEFIGSTYESGGWKPNGFRITPDRNATYTVANHRTQRENLLPFNPALIRHLTDALTELSGRRVVVYLSPLSGAQRKLFEEKLLTNDLAYWRQATASASQAMGAEFHDLTDTPEFDDFDPNAGSSQYWFDNLHFKPVVGHWVLQRIGLAKPNN